MLAYLLPILIGLTTASAPPIAARDACVPSSRWNITGFELIQRLTDPIEGAQWGETHGRDIAFTATSLRGPSRTFSCSARKFTIGSYEPPPQWDNWRASCFDAEALPAPREGPLMEIKFNMGMIPPGRGVPRHTEERARLGLRLVGKDGEVIEETNAEVALPCDIPADCQCVDSPDLPCEVYDFCWTKRECRPGPFCIGTVAT